MFLGFRREKILSLKLRPPRKSIPTGTRRLTQKTVAILPKMCSPDLRKKSQKNKKNIWTWYFTPLPGAPAGPIAVIFCMLGGSHDVITRTNFLVDRVGGYGATGAQNLRFPMHF